MRVLLLLTILCTSLMGAEEATIDYLQFQKKWKFYKIAPSSYQVIVDFVKQAKTLPDSELKLASYSFVTLGTYLQGEVAAGQRMQNEVEALAARVGERKWHEFCKISNFGVQCTVCAGEQKKARICRDCAGNKRCSNKDCRRGKIGVLSKQGNNFVEVEKDCPVCNASGDCQTCKGTGQYFVKCRICKGFGFKLDMRQVKESIEAKKAEMDGMVTEFVLAEYEKEQMSKGLIRRGNKWVTQEQIDNEERVASERSERLRLEKEKALAIQRQRQLKSEQSGLIFSLKNLVASDPNKAELILVEKFSGELSADINQKVTIFKEQIQLVKKAQELESRGNYPMAIRFYEQVDKMRERPYFKSHIRKLKLADIGL